MLKSSTFSTKNILCVEFYIDFLRTIYAQRKRNNNNKTNIAIMTTMTMQRIATQPPQSLRRSPTRQRCTLYADLGGHCAKCYLNCLQCPAKPTLNGDQPANQPTKQPRRIERAARSVWRMPLTAS